MPGKVGISPGWVACTWALALLLVGCQSSSSSRESQPGASAAASASAPAPAPALVVLHADGIGEVWFGMPQDAARGALIELWGEPDTEKVEFCELFESEQESQDRTLSWGDLAVSLRADQDGEVRLDAWSVAGPQTPPGLVTPYGMVPGVDRKATLLRSVQGVTEDEDSNDQLGPGHYIRGQLQWIVDDSGQVTHAYVNPAICD